MTGRWICSECGEALDRAPDVAHPRAALRQRAGLPPSRDDAPGHWRWSAGSALLGRRWCGPVDLVPIDDHVLCLEHLVRERLV